jgi:hypothetical protein
MFVASDAGNHAAIGCVVAGNDKPLTTHLN